MHEGGIARYATLLPAMLIVASCGRIGFDALPASGAEDDASFGEQDATLADASFGEQDAAPLDLSDPPSLAGVWSIKSLTYDTRSGAVVVPRATGGGGVLGEFELTSTGAQTFSFKASTTIIDDNLPLDYNIADGTMAIQPDDRWLMVLEDGDVIVLSAVLNAGVLSLIWEEADPRNTLVSFTPPRASVIERNYTFATTTAGDWNSLSLKYRDGKLYTPGACVKLSDSEYEQIDMDWHFDSLLRTTINVHWAHFSDAACSNQTEQETEVFTGLGQEDGTRLQFWGSETSFGPLYVESQLSFPGENLRFLVTSCLPTPGCLNLSEDHLFAPAP